MNYAQPPAPQGYPAQPMYPAQPQYPGYPQAQQPPAQQFPPQGYPPQGYPAQLPPQQPPAPPLAQGSLDDFYNQPSTGGGPSLKFEQLGATYTGVVARELGPGDVQQQTDTDNRPLFFRDGQPKWVMKVPLQVQPSQAHPDGQAVWYVKGAVRDELNRAMAEAGTQARSPEAGATITVTFVSTRNSGAGRNPAKVFQVRYTPPGQVPGQPGQPAQPQQAQPQQYAQPQAPQYPAQAAGAPSPVPAAQPSQQIPQQYAPPAQQQFQPQVQGQPGQAFDPQQLQYPGQPGQPVQPQGGLQVPADFNPEQAALLSRIAGQG